MYNLDSGDLQGNPELLIRAAQQEALAPQSSTIGIAQDAIVLLAFKIKDNAPNVPELATKTRTVGPSAESAAAETALANSRYRIACHAMIQSPSSDDIYDAQLSHSSHNLPNPFLQENLSVDEYFFLAKKYPIYVGDYIHGDSNASVGPSLMASSLSPGTPIVVRDNDVQGGVFGSIMSVRSFGAVDIQFAAPDLRTLFGLSAEPLNADVDGLFDYGFPRAYDIVIPDGASQLKYIDLI